MADEHHQQFFVFNLQRYDLGEVYTVNGYDRNYCNATKVSGNLPNMWSWVPQAQYGGEFVCVTPTLNAQCLRLMTAPARRPRARRLELHHWRRDPCPRRGTMCACLCFPSTDVA